MATVTVYTKDTMGKRAWELESGQNYLATMEDYGIIVIEDSLRVASGKTYGPFKDGRLTLRISKGGIDIEYGKPVKRANLNAKALYLVPKMYEDDEAKVQLTVAD